MMDELERFDEAWKNGTNPILEEYLGKFVEEKREEGFLELIEIELDYRVIKGENPSPDEYLRRFPGFETAVNAAFDKLFIPVASRAPRIGDRIGNYTLVREIGHGGMGVVYEATEENSPGSVALKFIYPERSDSIPELLGRFEKELKVLANLDHPSIPRLLAEGVTDDGLPYYVMELVDGVNIKKHCDQEHLSVRERLDLFVKVCDAIHHAHQSGCIHRDIKPNNVLVAIEAGQAVPKVIDFGLVKVIDPDRGDPNSLTRSGRARILGTAEYMSPEQWLNPGGVNTQADIYSLGVLLYELLVGTTPFGLQGSSLGAIIQFFREITEIEPPPMSARFESLGGSRASIAEERGAQPRQLARELRGNLDAIVLMALRKEKERRYPSADALAVDLRKFLEGAPVEARPTSLRYKAGKLVNKHPRVMASVGIVVLLSMMLLSAMAVVLFLARNEAILARVEAERARDESEQTIDFFDKYLLTKPRPKGPDGGLGKDATILQAINDAVPAIPQEFQGQPALEASIRERLGLTYMAMAEWDKAVEQHTIALKKREAALGPDDQATNISRNNLANAYRAAARPDLAIPLLERVIEAFRKMPDSEYAILICKNNLANAYKDTQKYEKAITLLTDVVNVLRSVPKFDQANPTFRPICEYNLGSTYFWYGEINKGIDYLSMSLKDFGIDNGAEDQISICQGELGLAYQVAERTDDAVKFIRETLDRLSGVRPADHQDLLIWRRKLAVAQADAGDYDAAEKGFDTLLKAISEKYGATHLFYAGTWSGLGQVYLKQKKLPDAERAFRACQTVLDTMKAPDQELKALNRFLLGISRLAQGRTDGVASSLEECYQELLSIYAQSSPLKLLRFRKILKAFTKFCDRFDNPADASRWRQRCEGLGAGSNQEGSQESSRRKAVWVVIFIFAASKKSPQEGAFFARSLACHADQISVERHVYSRTIHLY